MKKEKLNKLGKLKSWIFSLLTGFKIEDLSILDKASKYNEYAMGASGELGENYLFDFKNYGSLYSGNDVPRNNFVIPASRINIVDGETTTQRIDPVSGEVMESNPEVLKNTVPKTKIAIKPIDVLDQLETVPTPWTLSNLDDKLSILEMKKGLIVQDYSKREISALIERLTNRKKYIDSKEYFDGFQNTTDQKIDSLLSKYDLVMKTSDIFIPEFPDEAINIMKGYTDEVNKICGKNPIFYVIAEPDKFKKAYEKRDPILLVQSPFGFYWQILGAWDKEMILLGEL